MAAWKRVLRAGRIILSAIVSAGQRKREGPFCNRASRRVSTRRKDGRAVWSRRQQTFTRPGPDGLSGPWVCISFADWLTAPGVSPPDCEHNEATRVADTSLNRLLFLSAAPPRSWHNRKSLHRYSSAPCDAFSEIPSGLAHSEVPHLSCQCANRLANDRDKAAV